MVQKLYEGSIYDLFINLVVYKNLYKVDQENDYYLNKIPLPDILKEFYKYTEYDDKILLKNDWYIESLEDTSEFSHKYKHILPIITKLYRNRIYYVIFLLKKNPEYIYIGFEKINSQRYIDKYTDFEPQNYQLINFNQFIISGMNMDQYKDQIDHELL